MSVTIFLKRYRHGFSRAYALLIFLTVTFSGSAWDEESFVIGLSFLIGCMLVGLAVIGRLWCLLYISGYKSNTLIMQGPYSICRNPLYFFSLLGALGVGLASERISIMLFIALGFFLYYPFVIAGEEEVLTTLHPDRFEEYRAKTPCLFPNLRLLEEPEEYVVKPKRFRKGIFDALWFVWFIGLLELLEMVQSLGIIPVYFDLY